MKYFTPNPKDPCNDKTRVPSRAIFLFFLRRPLSFRLTDLTFDAPVLPR
jgi:hypothetical protein